MKRLRRWLDAGMTVLALLLTAALAAGWVRSYWACDGVSMPSDAFQILWKYRPSDGYEVASSLGRLQFRVDDPDDMDVLRHNQWKWRHEIARVNFLSDELEEDILANAYPARQRWYFLGLELEVFPKAPLGLPSSWTGAHYNDITRWTIPYWFPVLISAAVAFPGVLAFIRRRRRPKPGFCRACGYDLRATPDRCPECGVAAKL